MPRPRRYAKLGRVPDGSDPNELRQFLQRVKDILETVMQDRSRLDARPTISQMEEAGVTNAEDIE